jgi:hypothetical protein
MIYFPLSKFVDSAETVVAPGAAITAEGQALVRMPGAPAKGVTPSMAADDTEIFAGFAVAGVSAAPLALTHASKVEEFVVPASGVATLAFTPVANELSVFNLTTMAAVAPAGPASTGAGPTLTGLTAGTTVRVTYKYALSAVQARALQGDVQPGGYAGEYVGQVGLIKRGLIFTDQFDASVDWSAATEIKLAANGTITDQSGTGAAIKGYVVTVPNVETPFLGIEFSAA